MEFVNSRVGGVGRGWRDVVGWRGFEVGFEVFLGFVGFWKVGGDLVLRRGVCVYLFCVSIVFFSFMLRREGRERGGKVSEVGF